LRRDRKALINAYNFCALCENFVSPAVIDFKELTQRAQRSTERTEEIVNDRSMGFPSRERDLRM